MFLPMVNKLNCFVVHLRVRLFLVLLTYFFVRKNLTLYQTRWPIGTDSERDPKESALLTQLDDPIYPTPPLGQDMTQGQFLSGV